MEKLFNTLSNSTSNQPLNVQSLLQRPTGNSTHNNHTISSEPTHSNSVKPQPPPDLVQTISSYILKIFLIDKQIEELSQEKMKVYSELLSIKDISSSLFNSWAQEQINKGNIVNCQTNQSNIIPQLMRLNGITNHSDFVEALAPERYLKKENPDVLSQTVDNVPSPVSTSSHHQANPICSTPPNKPPEIMKPKLSVRKDLHDHNLHNSNPEQGIVPLGNEADEFHVHNLPQYPDTLPTEVPKESCFVKVEGGPRSFSVSEAVETPMSISPADNCETEPWIKKTKKKKSKKKKENILEVVELLDSTEDESESVVSFEGSDPLATGIIVKKQSTVKNVPQQEFSISVRNTITCMKVS